ncbi:MAG: peptidylprolyl isomerase [Pirellulaceae bacterium]
MATNGIDTLPPVRPARRWTTIVTACASLAAVLAVCLFIRNLGSPQASAQSPAGARPTPAAQRGAAPRTAPVRTATGAAPRAAVPAGAAAATGSATATPRTAAATMQVMAVVNGEQITRADLGRECIHRYGEEVLESLVNRHLIVSACQRHGVQITEQDVTDEVERIAARFGLARDRWLTMLQEERGFSEAQYKREVVWPMLALRGLAAGQIEVTQDELKRAFDSEFGSRVKARLIAVESLALAHKARAEAAANPAAFGEISKKYSKEPAVAAAYGVIPPIRRGLGDENLEQAAFNLKVGEISQPVQVANMHYILKCEEQIPAQYISSQQVAEQEKRLAERIREAKMRVAAAQMMEQVQKSAQVVNVYNDPDQAKAQPGVAATVNGQPIGLAQLADECITRHGVEVLDGEINRKLLQQELKKKQQTIDKNDIDAEVARAADAYGVIGPDGKPDVDRWLKTITEEEGATVDLYVRDAVWPSVALKKLVSGQVEVTPEDLQKGYESNYGERVNVLAVVLGDQRQAQKVWEMARNNPTDAFFAELAQQYSIEPASRSNGGKVPPIRQHGGSPQIETEAFKLKRGELSGLIAIEKQFIILRCLGRTQPVKVDFAAVKKELVKDIEEKMLRVLMTREFDRLHEMAQIDNFLAGTTQSGRPARPATAISPAKSAIRPVPGAPATATRAAPKAR